MHARAACRALHGLECLDGASGGAQTLDSPQGSWAGERAHASPVPKAPLRTSCHHAALNTHRENELTRPCDTHVLHCSIACLRNAHTRVCRAADSAATLHPRALLARSLHASAQPHTARTLRSLFHSNGHRSVVLLAVRVKALVIGCMGRGAKHVLKEQQQQVQGTVHAMHGCAVKSRWPSARA